MCRVVDVVGHIGLNVGENVLVVVHIVPYPLCHINQDVLYVHTPSVTVDCCRL